MVSNGTKTGALNLERNKGNSLNARISMKVAQLNVTSKLN
jgi:hypothetical protein